MDVLRRDIAAMGQGQGGRTNRRLQPLGHVSSEGLLRLQGVVGQPSTADRANKGGLRRHGSRHILFAARSDPRVADRVRHVVNAGGLGVILRPPEKPRAYPLRHIDKASCKVTESAVSGPVMLIQ